MKTRGKLSIVSKHTIRFLFAITVGFADSATSDQSVAAAVPNSGTPVQIEQSKPVLKSKKFDYEATRGLFYNRWCPTILLLNYPDCVASTTLKQAVRTCSA